MVFKDSAFKNVDRQSYQRGKENLNFSEWGSYSSRKQGNKLDRISKQIKSDEMPLFSTLIHRDAILATTQREELIHWIDKVKDSLSLKQ
jgi:hypothetical protein